MNRMFNGVSAVLICLAASGLAGCGADGANPGPSESVGNDGFVSEELALRNRLTDRLNANPADQGAIAELAELDRLTDARVGLIYKLVVGEGHELAFFEPTYGELNLMETAPLTADLLTSALDSSKVNIHDLFAAARPGEDVPAVLRALQTRVDEASSALPTTASEARATSDAKPQLVPGGSKLAHATSSGTHFEVDHGGCPAFGAIRWCFVNATSNFTKSATNVISSRQIIANYGTTTFTFTITVSSLQESRTIAVGEVRSFSKFASTRGAASGRVGGATSASRWHFGGYFD